MSIPAKPKMYIDENPTFQELLEIRESLFPLIKHRALDLMNAKEMEGANSEIRSKIKLLRANALYKAGKYDTFEKDLETLSRRTSNNRYLLELGVKPRKFHEMEKALRGHFNRLVESIRQEARWREEEFKLEELSVKSSFKKRDQGGSSDAHVKEIAERGKGAQFGEAKLKPVLEEGMEDFWNQFVVKNNEQQTDQPSSPRVNTTALDPF